MKPRGRRSGRFTRNLAWIFAAGLLLAALRYEVAASSESRLWRVAPGDLGTFPQWSRLEIVLVGPDSVGMGRPNPFRIDVDVRLTGPGGVTQVVPAFYDGNGSGGMDGDVWKVRFSPGAAGAWSYSSASSVGVLNGQTGTFNVTEPSGCQPTNPGELPDLACVGRLVYAGAHYLAFTDGSFWLKGEANEPEDILAPGVTGGFPTRGAAVDFLADRGVNSPYILLNNVGGDYRNVWPWVGGTESEAQANHDRFDVSKLAAWEEFFTSVQQQGMVLHMVLEDDSA